MRKFLTFYQKEFLAKSMLKHFCRLGIISECQQIFISLVKYLSFFTYFLP